jgi:hypothetical protein
MNKTLGLLMALLATGCAAAPSRPPVVTPATDAVARAACSDIYLQELQRSIDTSGTDECLRRIRAGAQDADLRAWVRASDEYAALQERLKQPPAPVLSLVHLDGKALRLADGRPWAWRYASAFTILARSDGEQDAFLDWAQGKHFTGLRILTTAVLLADLPPDVGRARLPAFLEKLAARGMGAEVVALADTKPRGMSRAAMREHVAGVAAIVAAAQLPLTWRSPTRTRTRRSRATCRTWLSSASCARSCQRRSRCRSARRAARSRTHRRTIPAATTRPRTSIAAGRSGRRSPASST